MSQVSFGSTARAARPVGPRTSWYLLVAGVVFMVAGLVAFGNLLLATLAVTYVIGGAMLAGGVVMLYRALQAEGWGWVLLYAICGLLYLGGAIAVLQSPVPAAAILTLWLAPLFAMAGALRLIDGLASRSRHWGWAAWSGGMNILAAIIVVAGWPANTIWVLGLILAVDLIVQGVASLMVGFTLHDWKRT